MKIVKIGLLILISCVSFLISGCASKNTTTLVVDEYSNPTVESLIKSQRKVSYDVNDYIGDYETFTYGLIVQELRCAYDTFSAHVELSDSTVVYGIGFTDFSDCYTEEDNENVVYVMSGFIPFYGEVSISDEEFDSGLLLYNLDYQDEETIFVWGYKLEEKYEHCVVFGKYLKYGVDENGYVDFEVTDYTKENTNKSLGSLYSYDDTRYLYDTGFGEYTPITGETLADYIDYSNYEELINSYIENQDIASYNQNVETSISTAKEAVLSYLMSLNEETFFGYNVNELIELTNDLDKNDIIKVAPSGLEIISVEEYVEKASTLVRTMVGFVSGVLAVAGVVGSIVFVECPALSGLAGALTGFAVDMFVQVAVSGSKLSDVDWKRVGISAACGFVSGFIGPYIQTLSGVGYFIADSVADGIISGIEAGVMKLIEGGTASDVLTSFGTAFVLGAVISGTLKGVGKAISAITNKVKNTINISSSNKIASKISGTLGKIKNTITKGLNNLKKVADDSFFHSSYIGKKLMFKQIATSIKYDPDSLAYKSIKGQGSLSPDGILDNSGNKISKDELYDAFKKAKDNDIIGHYEMNGEYVYIWKKNGAASVIFGGTEKYTGQANFAQDILANGKYQSVDISSNKTYSNFDKASVRKENMLEASSLFQKKWVNDPDSIPSDIADAIRKNGSGDLIDNLSDMSSEDIRKIIEQSSWTLHENIDLTTVSLVPSALHNSARGYNGISHFGGAALETYVKNHMGSIYFETLISAAASGWARESGVIIGGAS
ncbi:MAG: sulfite exporter TauE/SafE family protein [Clostridia bacterium]|nr:sulfite exporter TauE/SafE family protein [Clostridia bacterium]